MPINERQVIVKDREKEKLKEPPKYKVVMINDDYTPMDFVIAILIIHFGHSKEKAFQTMMEVHEKGKGVAGVYPKDIAETKAVIVMEVARRAEHPLLVVVEKE